MSAPLAPRPAAPLATPGARPIGSDTSRLANRANLEAAGRQFEQVFVQMMVKSMRQTHLAEDIFGSKALDTFRDMQDEKLAAAMTSAKPLGIGKAVVDFLAKAQPDLNAAGDKAVP
ncbi:MAG: rod-binding protein [Proteobacteria bacterium SG_bin5]|nr:MAG: rod-binding protein [Proteobacteria bacterium SG_bin5]